MLRRATTEPELLRGLRALAAAQARGEAVLKDDLLGAAMPVKQSVGGAVWTPAVAASFGAVLAAASATAGRAQDAGKE